MISVVFLSPIIAVQLEKYLEKRREVRVKKIRIFSALMSTRATPLAPLRIEALNLIDIEFYESSKIREAWKALLDNYADVPSDKNLPNFQQKLELHFQKREELNVDLLFEMAKDLGYHYDKVQLKKGCYIPQGHAELELDNAKIRQGFMEILSNKKAFPIAIINHNVEHE